MCVGKIYIYSSIATAGKAKQEKRLNTSKTKFPPKKKIHQGEKKVRRRKKKQPKMNAFLTFFNKKHNALQKANTEVEICRGNKPCDL